MNRRVVAGLLGLAVAGCAQDRSLSSRPRTPVPTVGLTPPMDSIHAAINRDNPKIDPGSTRAGHSPDPADRPAPPAADSLVTGPDPSAPPPAAKPAEGDSPTAAGSAEGGSAPAAAGAMAGRPAPFVRRPGTPRPQVGETPRVAASSLNDNPSPGPAATPAEPAAPNAPRVAAAPEAAPQPLSDAVKPSPAAEPAPAAVPTATEGRVPIAVPGAGAPAPAAGPGPEAGRDPLLGPNPDVMPDMSAIPAARPPKSTTPAPAGAPAASGLTAPEAAPLPAAEPAKAEGAPAGAQPAPSEPVTPTPVVEPPAAAEPPATAPERRPRPDAQVVPTRSAPVPGHAARYTIAPQAGEPPRVSDIPGNTRPPTAIVPPPAGFQAGGATASPSASAASVPPSVTPAPARAPSADPFAEAAAAPASAPAPVQAPAPHAVVRDPLLGPNPDIMPAIELPPAPAGKAAGKPAPAPAPAPAKVRKPVPTTPDPEPSASKPADPLAAPVELPPLTDPEPAKGAGAGSASAAPRPSPGFASVPVSAPAAKARVPQDGTKAADPTAVRSAVPVRSVFQAGMPAARVGDDVITLHELTVAIAQRRKGLPPDQTLSANDRYMLARMVLNDLVDRTVVLQEAKHQLKDPKKYKQFMDMADGVWVEQELPPMLRQSSTMNIHELKQKMTERGESLDEIREQFRLEFLSRGYLEQKLGPKMQVGLLEMRKYYADHQKEYDRPAQVTWREILIEVDKHKSRAEARRKADAVLARLRRGDDFVAVAKAESDGPNRAAGGYWQTAPGGYNVPAVNAALESLPAGQVSALIEGPTSYHVVRVEDRRRAGPAPFDEVQDKIRGALRQEKVHRESTAYLEKLRKRTVISTVFDDPGVTAASAEVVRPGR